MGETGKSPSSWLSAPTSFMGPGESAGKTRSPTRAGRATGMASWKMGYPVIRSFSHLTIDQEPPGRSGPPLGILCVEW